MVDDQDVQATEITLDDFNADEQESPKAESSPAEDKKPEVVETPKEDETKVEPEAKDAETDGDTAESDTEETSEELPKEEPLKPKSENRYQKLANENRELKGRIEQLTAEAYEPQTVEQLTDQVNPKTGEAYTVAEAAQAAVNEQMAMRDYNSQILSAQNYAENEAHHVLSDYAWANSDSDQYDEDLALEAMELVEDKLVRDPNIPEIGLDGKPTGKGLVVDVKGSIAKIYKTLDRASSVSQTKGQLKGQQDTEKMLANADAVSNAAPPKAKEDPLIALWKSDD